MTTLNSLYMWIHKHHQFLTFLLRVSSAIAVWMLSFFTPRLLMSLCAVSVSESQFTEDAWWHTKVFSWNFVPLNSLRDILRWYIRQQNTWRTTEGNPSGVWRYTSNVFPTGGRNIWKFLHIVGNDHSHFPINTCKISSDLLITTKSTRRLKYKKVLLVKTIMSAYIAKNTHQAGSEDSTAWDRHDYFKK